jgi:hypothetical protein
MLLWLERLKPKTMPYIACFSEDHGDRLSQWRGYAAQGGVSIGFKLSRLKALCESKPSRLYLQKVLYVNPAGGKATDDIIDNLLQLDFNLPGSPNFGYATEYTALHWGVGFKDIAFKEEEESRLVLLQTSFDTLKHRLRGSLMVPYLELEIDQQSDALVEQVIVGPNAHQKQTAESIKGLLKVNGWNSVAVKCSKTPYRGW